MTASEQRPRSSASPWFHLLGSPIIWAAHFLTGYAWVEFACQAQLLVLNSTLLGLPVTSHVVLGLTLMAVLATGYVGWSAYRRWDLLKQRQEMLEASHWVVHGERFMALGGVILSMLFGPTILLTGLPALVLKPC